MPANRPDFVDQNLKCVLTDAHKIRTAEALARSLQDRETLEEEKKKQLHQFAERMDGLNESIKKAFIVLQNGYEYKWTACKVLYNDPKIGEKTLVRMDTGEVVRVEDMSFAECQESLPLATAEPSEFKNSSEYTPFEEIREAVGKAADKVASDLFPERQDASSEPQAIAAAGPDPLASDIAEASQKGSKRKTKRASKRKVLTVTKGSDDGTRPNA